MKLTIELADNGYGAYWLEDDDEHFMVFQGEGEEEGAEVKCFAELLYFVTEFFGMIGSKHDKYRIRITTGGEDE